MFAKLVFDKTSGFGTPRAELLFPNGYGVSVFHEPDDDEKYEVAVIGPDGRLCYSTPVTQDVERFCDIAEVERIMAGVEALS